MFLIIAGCIWVGLSTILVLSLMCAASRRVPRPHPEPAQRANAAAHSQDSEATGDCPPEESDIDPVLDA